MNNDIKAREHVIDSYSEHQGDVFGLKWSASGQQLASGENDNLVFIWDRSMAASSNLATLWLHRLEDHTAVVRALAWCPFQGNLLASCGGGADKCIRFWNTHTGACLNSVDTSSEVCALLWSKHKSELLSAHRFTENQLTIWKYLLMVKMAELTGHTSRVLFMAQV
ncbi:hypothetical protein LWI29_033159 [Acer saccharum]|uniref:Uncharacterized protein n=1 Tax=Acer saccharum TaxID=4024 RepID=A0AA39RT53_ACESA|nr:hypothetical protein LWI29_033159 [Acer saccharum]